MPPTRPRDPGSGRMGSDGSCVVSLEFGWCFTRDICIRDMCYKCYVNAHRGTGGRRSRNDASRNGRRNLWRRNRTNHTTPPTPRTAHGGDGAAEPPWRSRPDTSWHSLTCKGSPESLKGIPPWTRRCRAEGSGGHPLGFRPSRIRRRCTMSCGSIRGCRDPPSSCRRRIPGSCRGRRRSAVRTPHPLHGGGGGRVR